MRHITIIFMLMMTTLLVACGGEEATPVPDTTGDNLPQGTSVGVVEVATDSVVTVETLIAEEVIAQNPPPFIPTLPPLEEGALPVPLVGTMVASETEDPNRGMTFDYISLVQEGGVNNERITIQIYGDGRVTFNDREGRIGDEDIQNIVQAIDDINFFGLQGTFLGPAPREGEYTYQIVVRRDTEQRRINAQDGYIPQAFVSFLAYIRNIAEVITR